MANELCAVSVRTAVVRVVNRVRILLYFIGSRICRLPIYYFYLPSQIK